jgi:hypothetical protein
MPARSGENLWFGFRSGSRADVPGSAPANDEVPAGPSSVSRSRPTGAVDLPRGGSANRESSTGRPVKLQPTTRYSASRRRCLDLGPRGGRRSPTWGLREPSMDRRSPISVPAICSTWTDHRPPRGGLPSGHALCPEDPTQTSSGHSLRRQRGESCGQARSSTTWSVKRGCPHASRRGPAVYQTFSLWFRNPKSRNSPDRSRHAGVSAVSRVGRRAPRGPGQSSAAVHTRHREVPRSTKPSLSGSGISNTNSPDRSRHAGVSAVSRVGRRAPRGPGQSGAAVHTSHGEARGLPNLLSPVPESRTQNSPERSRHAGVSAVSRVGRRAPRGPGQSGAAVHTSHGEAPRSAQPSSAFAASIDN